jgi:LacI family transcriptional regulator
MYEMGELGPMKILESASAAARRAGYSLDIVHMDPYDDESLIEAIDVATKLDVAGILAFAPNDRMRAQLNLTHFRVPLYVETEDDEAENDSNRPNFNAIGAELAVRHLVELGHTTIAHISGPLDWPSSRLRARSYKQVLEAEGLPVASPFEGNWSAESGYRRTVEILESGLHATAIFAANDQMALGALHALAEADVAIPGAMSVIGMDGTPEARYYTPSLSTIPMHFDVQGQYAFEAILGRINGLELPEKTEYVHTKLMQRDSTGPVPH